MQQQKWDLPPYWFFFENVPLFLLISKCLFFSRLHPFLDFPYCQNLRYLSGDGKKYYYRKQLI